MILNNNNSQIRYSINGGNYANGVSMYSPNMSKKSPALTHNGSHTNPQMDPSNNKYSHSRNNTHPNKMVSCFTQTNNQDYICTNDNSNSHSNRYEGSIGFTAIQARTHNQCQSSHSQRNKENHQPNKLESMADILCRNNQISKQIQQLNIAKNNNKNNLRKQTNTRNQYCSNQPQISQFLPQQLQNVTVSRQSQSNQAQGEQSPNSLLMQNLNNIMSVKMNTKQLQQELQHFINIITKLRKQNDYYKQQLQAARQENRQILNQLHQARMAIVDAQEHNDRLSRMLTIWKQRATILKQINQQQLIGQHGTHTLYQYSQQAQQCKQYQQQHSPSLLQVSQQQQNSTYSHLLYNCRVGRSIGRSRTNSISNNRNNSNSSNGNGSSENSINISQLLKMKQQRCDWDGVTKNKQQQNLYGKIVRSNSKSDRYPQSHIHAQTKHPQYIDQSTII